MERGRPASADGERPSSGKFERPCDQNSPPSAPSSRGPSRKAPRPTSLEKIVPVKIKFDRACYPEPDKSRKVYDYGVDLDKRRAAADLLQAAIKFAKSRQEVSPPKTSPSSPFKRWGSPFPQTCRKSSYSCSPNLTIFRHVSAGSEYVPGKKRSPTWQNSAADMQRFFGGSNLVSRRMLVMTACAAGSRAPMPESKARKLVFYKRWDKESFVEELEMLKGAVADQAYHFNLHKVHIHNLRTLHHRLEEKLAAIESIDGSEAPRTGGASRLSPKIAGMLMKITNLEENVGKYQENIQNLKYRYQVCLTREAYIQRDMTAEDARRVQKEYRVLGRLHKEMTAHNKKYLLIRDTILPELKAWMKQKEDNIKGIKQKMQENDELAGQFTNEAYAHKKQAASAVSRASSLEQQARSLRAKLKYEGESKRATREKMWATAYDTSLVKRDNRTNDKRRRAMEADSMMWDAPPAW